MKKFTLIAGSLSIALAAAILLYRFSFPLAAESQRLPDSSVQLADDGPAVGTPQSLPADARTPGLVEQLARQYQKRYGDSIDHPATQARLLGERQSLLQSYPEQGGALFEAAIALAFPEFRDDILTLLARLTRYHDWLDEHHRALQAMSLLERKGTIWQKREELFGDAARLIWIEEETAEYRKQEKVEEELRRLEQAAGISPEEAVYQLQSVVEDVYGNDLGGQLIGPGVMASAIFSLGPVQQQLQALPEDQRQGRINDLRRQMGYSEDAIERLETRDQERNARWEKGRQYMAERDQLSQQFTGEQLDQQLEALRQKHFGRTARTIRLEEQDGFFRYNRGRRLGLN